MAVSQTARMALTRWTAGADPFTRAQMDDDHAQLEAKAAGFLRGTIAARPAAADANIGFLYEATDEAGRLYWSTGASWIVVGPQFATGTYTGNGAATRTIALGFTPKEVRLGRETGLYQFMSKVGPYGFRIQQNAATVVSSELRFAPEVTTNGFMVGTNGFDGETNYNGHVFSYLAIG